jgi:hypothetical protein
MTGSGVERKTLASGYLFGAPVKDFGFFATLLIGFATGFIVFFAATFVGIVVVMVMIATGHPADYTLSYRAVGLPAGIVAGLLALGYLGTMWVKRMVRAATKRG